MQIISSPLDNPEAARNAWARYRRLMRWMSGMALVAVVLGLAGMKYAVGDGLTIHMMIATAGGIAGSVLLGAALMGLVFLSSGSGHDEAIDDPFKDVVDQ